MLRGDVLRMDRDEAAALIADHARTTSAEVFEAINAQTQGWCAAIVLTARAVGAAPDPVAAARQFARGDAKIADQVASEVFATLQPAERHLLLCTAGEEVVAVSTAALLTNNPRAGEVLAGLEVTGLLVSRVGGQRASGRLRSMRSSPPTCATASTRCWPRSCDAGMSPAGSTSRRPGPRWRGPSAWT